MRAGLTADQRLTGKLVAQDGRRRPGWRGLTAGLAASAVTAWMSLMPASGQTSGVTYTFSPTSGPAGTEVSFSGSGCPNEPDVRSTGRFDIFSAVDGSTSGSVLGFATFRSDASGNFSGRIERLAEGPLGPHRTLVHCTGGTTSRGDFTITAATTTTTVAASPSGSTSTTVVAAGGGGGTVATTSTTAVPSTATRPAAAAPATPTQATISLTG